MDATALLLCFVTLLLGALAGWLSGRRRGDADARAAQDHTRAAQDQLRAAESDAASSRTELVRLQTALDGERAGARDREDAAARAAAKAEAQLREAFGALSAEALRRNNEAFVTLAETRLAAAKVNAEGDLAQRQQAIEGMVGPLRESLARVQEQLAAAEQGRVVSESALREHLGSVRQSSDQLRLETSQLVTALRAPQVRGRWGELQLERTVEAAGMTEHIDYVTQQSVAGEDGAVRPDLVVRLVGGKQVVVDSKVAFSGYLEAMEARDEATRAARMKAHARHLRTHIDQLSAKAYWEKFQPSPEFVVCFVPADAFLDAALREDPTLLEHAFARNVVLATPSTLIALLRTVAYSWRQEALARNAAEVHRVGKELYTRLSTMGGHVDKLGRALGSAVTSYNQTVSSLESRVLVTARKMADLQVVDPSAEPLKAPAQITETARSAQAAEFADQRVVALPRGVKGGASVGQVELPGAVPDASNA